MWAERNRKLSLRGSRKRLWRSCLPDLMLCQFCPQGSAKAKTEDNSWLLNSEGNHDGIFVGGKRQTALLLQVRPRKTFLIKKDQKTAVNKAIITRNRTLTSKGPWNKNGSKSTNHRLQTVTFWTLWNEHLFYKSGRHSKNHGSPAFGISISRRLRRSTTTQYRQLRRLPKKSELPKIWRGRRGGLPPRLWQKRKLTKVVSAYFVL